MIDQIKNKINNLSSSAASAEKAGVKQSKAQVQKVEQSITKNKVDVDGGKVSQFVNKETIIPTPAQTIILYNAPM